MISLRLLLALTVFLAALPAVVVPVSQPNRQRYGNSNSNGNGGNGNGNSAEDIYQDYAREIARNQGEFNDRCKSLRDCRKFGYVCRDNRTCQCDYMYIPNFQRTACVGGVNQRCIYDEHCIEGAYCMNQAVCKCKDTTPISLDDGLMCSSAVTNIPIKFGIAVGIFQIVFFIL